jgi:hypothetical protein
MAEPFKRHRDAALALLAHGPNITRKAASFLGHLCVDQAITAPQRKWLVQLLEQNGLSPLEDSENV